MKRFDYRKTHFDIPSNRKLWNTLGGFDALMQYVEAACISYKEKQIASELSFEEFLEKEKDIMSHPISSLVFQNPLEKLHELYLVYPYSCLDVFIDDFVEDMRTLAFSGFSLADTNKISKLERLIIALKRLGINPKLYDFSMPIYNYFRYLRNGLNHNGADEGDAKLLNSFKVVSTHKADIDKRFNNLNALTECGKLNFGDYVLCTANIKNIADLIVLSIESHINWDNFYLSEDNHPAIKKINGYNRERQISYVNNVIQSTYSIILPSDKCGVIVDNTIAHF